MSYKYGFFDAVDLGNGNYDRVYSSAEFSHYWALLVGDGVFGQPSTSLNVLAMEPVAMGVKVAPGTGWIKGHYLTVPDNMDEVILVPVANPSLPRIDSIIMALNNADRDMKLYLRSGNAAASPKPVTLQRDADVWELELAQITVAAGAGNITQTAIKDMRPDPNRCGIVTGLIDQFDVSGFFTAAQASFNEWFEDVKSQLGDDVAGNLLNLIQGLQESKLDVSAKASTSEATAGTNDTKYMTPLKTKQAVDKATSSLEAVGDIRVSGRDLEALTSGEYLSCDGRALSRTTYSALYNAIGTKFGSPISGSTARPSGVEYTGSNLSYYAWNNRGGTPTQGMIGLYSGSNSQQQVVVTTTSGITQVLPLPNRYYYIRALFYIGPQAYCLAQEVDDYSLYLYMVGTTLQQIWTLNPSNIGIEVKGMSLVGSTMYIVCSYGYTSSSPLWGTYVLAVTGAAVSWTPAWQSTSSMDSIPPVLVLGNYMYLGGTVNRRALLSAPSTTSYTDANLTKFMNFMSLSNNYTNGSFYFGSYSPDHRTVIAYRQHPSDGYYPVRGIAVISVNSTDSSFTYKELTLDTGKWAVDEIRYYEMLVDNSGNAQVWACNRSSTVYWGNENDGRVTLLNSYTFPTSSSLRLYYQSNVPSLGVLNKTLLVNAVNTEGGGSTTYYWQDVGFMNISLTQFNLPDSSIYAKGGPNKEFIRSKEVT